MKTSNLLKIVFFIIFISPFLAFGTETDTTRIVIKKNEKYQIALEYCPGAGNYWTIADTTDKAIIKLVERQSTPKDDKPRKGGMWIDLLAFQGVEKEKKIINIEYKHLKETQHIKVLIFDVIDEGAK